jgi:uncharacterized protein (UPF0333 family)
MLYILLLAIVAVAAFFAGAHNAKRANAFTAAAKEATGKAKEAAKALKK